MKHLESTFRGGEKNAVSFPKSKGCSSVNHLHSAQVYFPDFFDYILVKYLPILHIFDSLTLKINKKSTTGLLDMYHGDFVL